MGIRRLKPYEGPTLFSYGFRPFFLFGAIYAGLSVAIWLPLYAGELTLPTAFSPRDWHVHEMLYGYVPAVVTGFLLTAIPNWTGRLPLQGRALIVLVAVWCAGRLAVAFSATIGWLPALMIDCGFLLLVAAAAAREIAVGRNWGNLKVVALLGLLATGNVCFHVEAHASGTADHGIRVGLAVVVMLITLIGGRIVPSFTRNWLTRDAGSAAHRFALRRRLPAPFGRFDLIAVGAGAASLLSWIVAPESIPTGIAMLAAGLLHIVRLSRWAGDRTLREPLVLILHLGYAFVPLGFVLSGLAALGVMSAAAGIHAFAGGAIGTMTLAVMTRASLGHTGRALHASGITQTIYAAVVLAALLRVAAALAPAYALPMLTAAGTLWVAAFAGFGLAYGPIVARRRVDARG